MTIHFSEEYGGDMLYIHVCGNLFKADFDQFVSELSDLPTARKSYKLFDMNGSLHGCRCRPEGYKVRYPLLRASTPLAWKWLAEA